jgi:glyoxylase-like metal-dependent hydrolase (beta-lactamase superfamily II)
LFRVIALALAGLACGSAVDAAVAFHESQAPGYYRMRLGHFEITALSDGSSPLPMKQLLTNIQPEALDSALRDSFLDDSVETSINGFLVNTGSQLVLIDAGVGALLGPRHGQLIANLRAAGYAPEQIDAVYITHMHDDHVGGLLADGHRAFPNATVRAARSDADFWLSQSNMDKAPEALRGQFRGAIASMTPYLSAGRFKPFDGQGELSPGIIARPAPGHTPGHTTYLIESEGVQLWVVGDLVHFAPVQFANPSVTIKFDATPVAAALTRKDILKEASAKQDWVAGAHLAFPGIGHVRADGTGYAFVPANYTSAPWAVSTELSFSSTRESKAGEFSSGLGSVELRSTNLQR